LPTGTENNRAPANVANKIIKSNIPRHRRKSLILQTLFFLSPDTSLLPKRTLLFRYLLIGSFTVAPPFPVVLTSTRPFLQIPIYKISKTPTSKLLLTSSDRFCLSCSLNWRPDVVRRRGGLWLGTCPLKPNHQCLVWNAIWVWPATQEGNLKDQNSTMRLLPTGMSLALAGASAWRHACPRL
jgi:hypothetical protein